MGKRHLLEYNRDGMVREVKWRRFCPESLRRVQEQALRDNPLFLLYQPGPTSLVIQEAKRSKPIRVNLGDPHSCSCRRFRIDQDLCLHLCWTLLRKFKLDIDDPLAYQLGLKPGELNKLLAGSGSQTAVKHNHGGRNGNNAEELPRVPRRAIESNDTCPICLGDLLEEKKPVTHCRHGCGNPVHIACMLIVGKTQLVSLERAKWGLAMLCCPLCRGDFASWHDINLEVRNAPTAKLRGRLVPKCLSDEEEYEQKHYHAECVCCGACPVVGPLYRCQKCTDVLLCSKCVLDKGMRALHTNHGIGIRETEMLKWTKMSGKEFQQMAHPQASKTPRKKSKVTNLRAALDDVYASLNNTDAKTVADKKTLPVELVASIPKFLIRKTNKLLLEGQQCLLCLRPYQVKQIAMKLPCGHYFHSDCVTDWLSKKSTKCPLDNIDIKPSLMQNQLRHNALPSRPLGGKSKPLLTVQLSPRNKKNPAKDVDVGGHANTSTARLSVTSLSLPADANIRDETANRLPPHYSDNNKNNNAKRKVIKSPRWDDACTDELVRHARLRDFLVSHCDRIPSCDEGLDFDDLSDLIDIKCLRRKLIMKK